MAVDKSDARVRGMFAQIAPRYDFLNHLLSLGVDVYWRGRTVAKVPPDGDLPILDLCTGTGDLALAYYRAAAGKLRVVGADFCHPMLVIGRGKAAQAHADRLAFVEADAQTLPFPANQFQIVSVAFGLRNVSDTDRGLREMLRVCRPGGRIAVLEFSMPAWRPMRALYGWYFRRLLPLVASLFVRRGKDAYHYLPESVSEFPSGQALLDRMRAAGASQATAFPLTFGIATLYVGVK